MKESKIISLSILIIIALGFAVYVNSVKGAFVWDDEALIRDNIFIKDWSNTPKIFTQDIYASTRAKTSFYRPLLMITYMIDHSLWRSDARGYHITNILLHIFVALCIFWFINILFADRLLSLFASILFVIHPVHTEAVAYISGRADLLVSVFMFLCIISYIKYMRSKKANFYFIAVLCYIGSLLSKENALVLPLLLFLYHFCFNVKLKNEKKGLLSILAITFIYILLRLTFLRGLLTDVPDAPALFQRMPGFFVAITTYARLLFLPLGLHMEYGSKLFSLADYRAVLGIAILLSALTYLFRKRDSRGLAFFSLGWFFIALLPQSNLYLVDTYMAEHWLYLSSIGFFLIISRGLCLMFRSKNLKIFSVALAVSLFLFYACFTIRQNNYWRTPLVLYKNILKYAPESKKAHNNIGNALLGLGRKEEALAAYKKALEIGPADAETYNNIGNIYSELSRRDEAIKCYDKAIKINKNYASAYFNLGILNKKSGRTEEALALYMKAIEVDPNFARAHNNIGVIYSDMGKKEEAIGLYKKAIEINPDTIEAYCNIGIAYSSIGKYEDAISSYRKAIEIEPNFALAHINLAIAYYHSQQYALAGKHCDIASRLGYSVHPEFIKILQPHRK